jgi:hypothetical protein
MQHSCVCRVHAQCSCTGSMGREHDTEADRNRNRKRNRKQQQQCTAQGTVREMVVPGSYASGARLLGVMGAPHETQETMPSDWERGELENWGSEGPAERTRQEHALMSESGKFRHGEAKGEGPAGRTRRSCAVSFGGRETSPGHGL